MNSNKLARIFDWLGEALEKFNPSAYRFLAALLPYLTPIPVAWLTANSSATFLHFDPGVAFIFVFSLEGIGLWFTSLLVDSIVDFIRSRNWKTIGIVVLFGFAVTAYVYILVNLNVTLEQANTTNGIYNPALSKVITLLCFLPLITGIGNGYYKLQVERKTTNERNLEYERSQAEKIRQENRSDRMERYKLKHTNDSRTVTNEQSTTNVRRTKRTNSANERTQRTNGELRTFVLQLLDEYERTNRSVAGVSELARTVARTVNEHNGVRNPDGSPSEQGYERYKGYISDVRKVWLEGHQEYLQ